MGMIRLLICHSCRSVDELPAFHGRPEDDVLLEDLIARHVFPDGNEHMGKLAEIEEADWRDSYRRNAILEQIKAAVEKSSGFPTEWYATKSTYQDDALKCYKKHGRPDQGCIDYCDSKKRIGNPTRSGWQAGPRVFLCHFCPVETWVRTQEQWQRGVYK